MISQQPLLKIAMNEDVKEYMKETDIMVEQDRRRKRQMSEEGHSLQDTEDDRTGTVACHLRYVIDKYVQ